MKEKFQQALNNLRSNSQKRDFVQSVDLVINITDVDLRKTPLSIFFSMPHPTKVPKICGFFEKKSSAVDRTVSKAEMQAMDKDQVKNLAKDYDLFISSGPLMSQVALTFGKVLGPLGKMPNPKTGGVVMVEDEEAIKKAAEKMRKSTNIKFKELSVKVSVGKENMEDSKIVENALTVYNSVLNVLPNRKDNVRSVMLKLTMSKPERIVAE